MAIAEWKLRVPRKVYLFGSECEMVFAEDAADPVVSSDSEVAVGNQSLRLDDGLGARPRLAGPGRSGP